MFWSKYWFIDFVRRISTTKNTIQNTLTALALSSDFQLIMYNSHINTSRLHTTMPCQSFPRQNQTMTLNWIKFRKQQPCRLVIALLTLNNSNIKTKSVFERKCMTLPDNISNVQTLRTLCNYSFVKWLEDSLVATISVSLIRAHCLALFISPPFLSYISQT